VYGVEHGNKFNEFLAKVDTLKGLQVRGISSLKDPMTSFVQGPIYDVSEAGRHHFAEIEKKAEKLKEVTLDH